MRFINNFKSLLSSDIADDFTGKIPLQSDDSSLITGGGVYRVTIADDSGNVEIVDVEEGTMMRAVEGTKARSWEAGATVYQAMTAQTAIRVYTPVAYSDSDFQQIIAQNSKKAVLNPDILVFTAFFTPLQGEDPNVVYFKRPDMPSFDSRVLHPANSSSSHYAFESISIRDGIVYMAAGSASYWQNQMYISALLADNSVISAAFPAFSHNVIRPIVIAHDNYTATLYDTLGRCKVLVNIPSQSASVTELSGLSELDHVFIAATDSQVISFRSDEYDGTHIGKETGDVFVETFHDVWLFSPFVFEGVFYACSDDGLYYSDDLGVTLNIVPVPSSDSPWRIVNAARNALGERVIMLMGESGTSVATAKDGFDFYVSATGRPQGSVAVQSMGLDHEDRVIMADPYGLHAATIGAHVDGYMPADLLANILARLDALELAAGM